MKLPGLNKAATRETCCAIFLHTCEPHTDAAVFAKMILQWWKPDCDRAEFERLSFQWAGTLFTHFLDCRLAQCDKDIRIFMQGSEPAIEIMRVYDPTNPTRNL